MISRQANSLNIAFESAYTRNHDNHWQYAIPWDFVTRVNGFCNFCIIPLIFVDSILLYRAQQDQGTAPSLTPTFYLTTHA
jgi:hypothetical protein